MVTVILDNKHLFWYEIQAVGLPAASFIAIGVEEDFLNERN